MVRKKISSSFFSFFKKLFFLKKNCRRGDISIFLLGLLVLGGAIGVLLVQERQMVQEKAQSTTYRGCYFNVSGAVPTAVIGSPLNIPLNQEPRCSTNSYCYYSDLEVKVTGPGITTPEVLTISGFSVASPSRTVTWNTSGRQLGEYSFTVRYGGHDDANWYDGFGYLGRVKIPIPPCGKLGWGMKEGDNAACCSDCAMTCQAKYLLVNPTLVPTTPWLPAPECRREGQAQCTNWGVTTYPNYTSEKWCDCCLQCAPLPTFGLSQEWCYGPTPKAVGYGCLATPTPTTVPGYNWCREKTWAWNGTSEKLAGVCCPYNGQSSACEGIRYMKSKTQDNQLASSPADYDKAGEGCWSPANPGADSWCCKTCKTGNGVPPEEIACVTPTLLPTPTTTGTPTPTVTGTPPPTPTPTPNLPYLLVRARFKGRVAPSKMEATIIAKGTGMMETVILSEEGESGPIYLDEVDPGQTYDFLLYSWGFLTAKKSLNIGAGRNPAYGFLDFGLLKPGDLNGDNQINGIDWSLMKINYSESGGAY